MKPTKRKIELLCPARDADIAIAAIDHGADAVYMGASAFGARASAANSTADLARVADYAHQFGVRLYATVNTLVRDEELRDVERLANDLYKAGVDALIVQDMSLLRLNLPPIALHASTQCDLRTPEKAKFLQSLGFSQLVVARELTFDEIASIRDVTTVPLEGFTHGALCVSYNGRCEISQVLKGRSANRGECAQICRLSYDLCGTDGHVLVRGKHLLSLRDMNMSEHLQEMMLAGISSFKIEGRLKNVDYVKNVVAYYRQAMDSVLAANSDSYVRASFGKSEYTFTPQIDKSFNRGFTDYFGANRRPSGGRGMAAIDTPKSMGEYMGKVTGLRGRSLTVATAKPWANGDGLSYFNSKSEFDGCRVNSVEGGVLQLNSVPDVKIGAAIYRTFDKEMADILGRHSARRTIELNAILRYDSGRLSLDLSDARGAAITHSVTVELELAQQSQEQRQREVLGKLGNTHFALADAEVLPDYFIPASILTQLRREAVELLDRAWIMRRPRDYRKPEDAASKCFATELDYADNVANQLAAKLYRDHGVKSIEPALEVDANRDTKGLTVMHTRYCIRRELGACRRDKKARQLPDELFLRNGSTLLAVDCDCAQCEMRISVVRK